MERQILRILRNLNVPITLIELVFYFKTKKIFEIGIWEESSALQTIKKLRKNFTSLNEVGMEVISSLDELVKKGLVKTAKAEDTLDIYIYLTDKGSL